jgi:hypothetical protein
MLSGETAVGQHPVEAVTIMADIIRKAEASPFRYNNIPKGLTDSPQTGFAHALARASHDACRVTGAKAVVVFTLTGWSARVMSKYRPESPIYALTPLKETRSQLALYWGVTPLLCPLNKSTDAMIAKGESILTKAGYLRQGETILITAGGTKEPIDDVRYITNRSTGKLGRALAAEAIARHHRVLLLAPEGDREFGSTADLERELKRASGEGAWDVVLHAAAVSDYRPASVIDGKINSERDDLVIRLVRTPKLIAHLRDWFGRAFLVGFKLTSGTPPEERVRIAREQIAKNRTDACVENDRTEFGPGEHKARLVTADAIIDIPKGDKASVARAILINVERLCSE